MNNLPITYLSHLTKQIASGRALHAIAVANEYLAPSHPLRLALVSKAEQQNPMLMSANADVFQKLSAGEKFEALSTEEKAAVTNQRAKNHTVERRRFQFNGQTHLTNRSVERQLRGEPARLESRKVASRRALLRASR